MRRSIGWLSGFVVAMVSASSQALIINPTYVDAAGETWSADRIGVFEQAIDDWQALLAAPSPTDEIDVTVTFSTVTDGYLGQWQGFLDNTPYDSTSNTILFNAFYFTPRDGSGGFVDSITSWWDPTPVDASGPAFDVWDLLTVARHEIGHMLGFIPTTNWNAQIDSNGVFDPEGLNVIMEPGDYAHTNDGGDSDLMDVALFNGVRHGIDLVDAQMLAKAYGYTLVPEPAGVLLACVGGLVALRRRR